MAKKVKRRLFPAAPPLRFQEELARAERLIEQGAYGEALDVLTALNERYPNRPSVLSRMADVFFETEDYPNYLKTTYSLYNLTPNDPNVVFDLGSVCPIMGFPAFALQLYRQFLKRWPKHELAAEAQERVRQLEEILKVLISGASFPADPEIMALHDEVRLCMMMEEYARGRKIAGKLLAKYPNFLPALNNLSLICWMEGDLEEAIQTAQRVLDIDPQNHHALSNLSRFFYLQGQPEKAFQYAQRLKAVQKDFPEVWVKKVEALAFLGDDEGVVSVQYDDEAIADLSPWEAALFYCCRAASEYRLGNTQKARSLWRKALTHDADFPLAVKNLENLQRPPHERYSPWPLPMHYWISSGQLKGLAEMAERAHSLPEERGAAFVRRYLDEHTHLPFLARPILERGSPETKEFIVRLADLSGHPTLLEALKEYALASYDPDEQRLAAARILVEHEFIPPGTVKMWIEGKQTEILMFGFLISKEPRAEAILLGRAGELSSQAVEALQSNRPAEAERLFREAIQIQPQHPSLQYNLAMALQLQGKTAESEAVLDRVIESFPDYFFGRIALARRLIQAEKLDEARDVLFGLMRGRKELHTSEFSALAATQVDLLIAQKEYESVASWLRIWEQIYPDDPKLKFYKLRPELRVRAPRSRRRRK